MGKVLLGIEYDKDKCNLRMLENQTPKLTKPNGLTLDYTTSKSTRLCSGRMTSKGEYDSCRKEISKGKKCDKCSRIEAQSFKMHHVHTKGIDSLSGKQRERITQPHSLYLAGFRDGTIKVGTSLAHRLLERLSEQGAWEAIHVGVFKDGIDVRVAEDRVTEKLQLTQMVRMDRKTKSHINPMKDPGIKDNLEREIVSVNKILEGFEPDGEFVSLPWDRVKWDNLEAYPKDIETGSHKFTILDMCGKHAVIEPLPSMRTVIDLSKLVGYELGEGGTPKLEIQSSLF